MSPPKETTMIRTGQVVVVYPNKRVDAIRPKARGLAQHSGPPGWLEESDPAGCDFVHDGRSMTSPLTACPVSGAALLLNEHKTPP